MSERRRTPRLPRVSRPEAPIPAKLTRPPWAEALHGFYDSSFVVKDASDLADAADDFADLEPGEQAYHLGQLLFRQAEALEAIHGVLARMEVKLAGADLGALKHLAPIRVAVRDLADGQEELLGVIEQVGATAGGSARERDAEEDDDEEDAEVVEDEDHGNGDGDEPNGDSPLAREMTASPVVPFRPRPGAVIIDVDADDDKEGA